MANHYPVLQEQPLRLIQQLYKANPQYFEDPNCPYSKDIKDLLSGKCHTGVTANNGKQLRNSPDVILDLDEDQVGELDLDDESIIKELASLQAKLNNYWDEVKNSDKATDKNTFFRVSVSLLEKIVSLKEKMSNMAQVNAFMEEVLMIMGDICTPDQRNEVMERLRKFTRDSKNDVYE